VPHNSSRNKNQPHRSTQPGHPLVGRRNEYQPKGSDALRLGSKGRYGSGVMGGTNTNRVTHGPYLSALEIHVGHYKALYKFTCFTFLLYLIDWSPANVLGRCWRGPCWVRWAVWRSGLASVQWRSSTVGPSCGSWRRCRPPSQAAPCAARSDLWDERPYQWHSSQTLQAAPYGFPSTPKRRWKLSNRYHEQYAKYQT